VFRRMPIQIILWSVTLRFYLFGRLRRHLARRERGEIAGKAAASRDPMAEALIRAV